MFIDHLQNGHSINGELYADLLRQLRKPIKTKKTNERGFFSSGQCSNTRVLCFIGGCERLWLWTILILLISRHLTIICSPAWKKQLAEDQYCNDDDAISAVDGFFAQQCESFNNVVQALQLRWKKFVDPKETMLKINLIWYHSIRVSCSSYESFNKLSYNQRSLIKKNRQALSV